MKNLLYIFTLLLIVSCNNSEEKTDSFSNKEFLNKLKYQTEVYQADNKGFTSITLNRLTGKVYIAKNAVGFYEATNKSDLKVYKTPTYAINIINYSDGNPQILLTNQKTAQMYVYIVGHTSDFYEVNNEIKSLESKEDK